MSDRFDQLIDELCKELGLDDAKGFQDPVEISVDDMPVTLSGDARSGEEELLMYASLGVVPERREVEVYRGMLEGNLLWSATADATIGVNSETREGMIAYRASMEGLNGEGLASLLGHFVEVARNWRDYVKANETSDEVSPSDFMQTLSMRV